MSTWAVILGRCCIAVFVISSLAGCGGAAATSPTRTAESFAPSRPSPLSDASKAPSVAGDWAGEYVFTGCRSVEPLGCGRSTPNQSGGSIRLRLEQQGASLTGALGPPDAEHSFNGNITEALEVYGQVFFAASGNTPGGVTTVSLRLQGNALVGDFMSDQLRGGVIIQSSKSTVSSPMTRQ